MYSFIVVACCATPLAAMLLTTDGASTAETIVASGWAVVVTAATMLAAVTAARGGGRARRGIAMLRAGRRGEPGLHLFPSALDGRGGGGHGLASTSRRDVGGVASAQAPRGTEPAAAKDVTGAVIGTPAGLPQQCECLISSSGVLWTVEVGTRGGLGNGCLIGECAKEAESRRNLVTRVAR
jgi:hypothetical protein